MTRTALLVLLTGVCTIVLEAEPPSALVSVAARASSAEEDLLNQFLQSDRPPLTSYRARRRLEASTLGGRMSASLEAWTYLSSNGTFGFDVIREDGSALIRDRVLWKALDTEQRSHNQRETSQIELTRANYDFRVGAATGDVVTIGLLPRRPSQMLLEGTVTVRRTDGDVVRIDGSPSVSPSWWTRHVDIVRRYARVHGIRVPVEMSSRADVRVAGDSFFVMTYDYTMVNGRSIGE